MTLKLWVEFAALHMILAGLKRGTDCPMCIWGARECRDNLPVRPRDCQHL